VVTKQFDAAKAKSVITRVPYTEETKSQRGPPAGDKGRIGPSAKGGGFLSEGGRWETSEGANNAKAGVARKGKRRQFLHISKGRMGKNRDNTSSNQKRLKNEMPGAEGTKKHQKNQRAWEDQL